MNTSEIDTSNGVIFPFYDPDTNMVYLCGKVTEKYETPLSWCKLSVNILYAAPQFVGIHFYCVQAHACRVLIDNINIVKVWFWFAFIPLLQWLF